MAKKKTSEISEDKLNMYKILVATNPKIELKGVTMPYTSWNGHMFSFLDKDGNLGLRLPKSEIDTLLKNIKLNYVKLMELSLENMY